MVKEEMAGWGWGGDKVVKGMVAKVEKVMEVTERGAMGKEGGVREGVRGEKVGRGQAGTEEAEMGRAEEVTEAGDRGGKVVVEGEVREGEERAEEG